MRALVARLLMLFRRRHLEGRLDDEVRAHLELLTDDYVRRGMSADDAHFAARRAFGGIEPMKERHRDRRTLLRLEDFVRDVRYTVRSLRRSPGFTAVAVLTLALGVGANTALFGVVHGYLLQTVPVRDPDALIAFRWLGEHRFRQMSTEHAYVAGRGAGA